MNNVQLRYLVGRSAVTPRILSYILGECKLTSRHTIGGHYCYKFFIDCALRIPSNLRIASKLEKLKHRLRMKELEAKARMELPDGDEPITYNIVITEAPMPGPPQDNRYDDGDDELH